MKIKNSLLSKGETLVYLQDNLCSCTIPRTMLIQVADFIKDPLKQLTNIKAHFPHTDVKLAIRSSAKDEDTAGGSQAGLYHSVLNVDIDHDSICKAIDAVIESYLQKGKVASIEEEQVIVQEMVRNVASAGVLFTKDMKFGAPYFTINYDDVTGRTDTITSGNNSTSNKALYVFRGATEKVKSSRFAKLINAAKELESIFDTDRLDIEFAIDEKDAIFLLQVRPIAISRSPASHSEAHFSEHLLQVYAEVSNCFSRLQGVYGHQIIFGQMPDWNPVEIIGKLPSTLASSLYSYLITERIWSESRAEMGYKSMSGTPLMHIFSGQPFINVAASFYSFLPSKLNQEIASKLVESFLNRLRLKPSYHDKVEFEVAITCFTFDFENKIKRYEDLQLSEYEKKQYRDELISHTSKMISLSNLWASYSKIETLEQDWTALENKNLSMSDVPKLLDLCANKGTRAFSILARHAFIATSIMESLVTVGAISSGQFERFKSSINSVASEFVEDLNKFSEHEIDYEILMEKYGHLRPGTYNIESPRYDQMDKFSQVESNCRNISSEIFEFESAELEKIQETFSKYGLKGTTAEEFIDYARNAIEMRESSKFVFSKILSCVLEIIAGFAKSRNVSRREISLFSAQEIISFSKGELFGGKATELAQEAKRRQNLRELQKCVTLPLLLFDAENILIAPFFTNQPNFITSEIVSGEVKYIEETEEYAELEGKIVLIESADPGYDWIFSHNILGLITKFGGVNSHMSIRCAEFQIPSAIGCGSILFDEFMTSHSIRLDCLSSQIIKLR